LRVRVRTQRARAAPLSFIHRRLKWMVSGCGAVYSTPATSYPVDPVDPEVVLAI